jgi:nicotinamidase-related amidase
VELSLRTNGGGCRAHVGRAALVLCEVWADYWCSTLRARLDSLAARIGPFVERARAAGAVVVHAPSWLEGGFYDGAEQRLRALELPPQAPPGAPPLPELPEALRSAGCPDTPACAFERPRRQHPAIRIADGDWLISEDPPDLLYRVLSAERVDVVLVAGVHTNICVLDQPFGLRELARRQVSCTLVRDLTEAVDWATTSAVVEWIETAICPSVDSAEVVW